MWVLYVAVVLYLIAVCLAFYVTREIDKEYENMKYILDKHIHILESSNSIKELYDIESSFMKNISLYNYHKKYEKICNKFQDNLFKIKNLY